MQQYFHELCDHVQGLLAGDEVFTGYFTGEDSDFVRFNRSLVRQAGHVAQRYLTLDLVRGRRHASGTVSISGDKQTDRDRLSRLVADLREQREVLPEDPHLAYATEAPSTETVEENRLPDEESIVAAVHDSAREKDFVGIYAAGGVHHGFASSLGQRNWYSTWTFNLDWSFHRSTDKAVKSLHAGFEWDPAAFERKVERASEQLEVLAHPPRTIEPGRYRVYLAPAALHDIVDMVGGEAFGLKARRTKQTPLLRFFEDGARLDRRLSLVENTAEGVAPPFQEAGFVRPDRVVLVEGGAPRECLVSPRSAREYDVETNGASADESPLAVQVDPGDVPEARVLERLHTGIWIGNVWYLNYSDRNACRTTGMTRFATFWVENGRIQAPLSVMRFDETVYRMLGDNLEALTADREWLLDPSTYGARSTRSARLPGALVDDFTFTL